MHIYIGSDHAGFQLKETLKTFLSENEYTITDKGASTYNETDDFPDFIFPVAKEVATHIKSRGIVLGGSGQGEAMAANRIIGIRAAVYYGGPEEIITLSRKHNNANVLALGARFLSPEDAKRAVRLWLQTDFLQEEKYQRRNDALDKPHA